MARIVYQSHGFVKRESCDVLLPDMLASDSESCTTATDPWGDGVAVGDVGDGHLASAMPTACTAFSCAGGTGGEGFGAEEMAGSSTGSEISTDGVVVGGNGGGSGADATDGGGGVVESEGRGLDIDVGKGVQAAQ